MPGRGGHRGMADVGAPVPEHGPGGAARGYRARRTLGFGVEWRRQLTRRRTQLALGFMVVLPFLLVAAFTVGDPQGGRSGGLADLATVGAANFTLFTLFVSAGFLLVVVVALFCGDTVASEASWSSLRYLLAAPVPRAHLLRRKLLVAAAYAALALVLLPVVAFAAGGVFFGWEPLRSPVGDSFTVGTSLVRLAVVVLYIGVTLLFTGALAFALGVVTDQPLGAVGGAVMLVIVSNILDAVTALGHWRELLPTHYGFAFLDAVQPQIVWAGMARGALWSVGYAVVLIAFAWWHFDRKDVTS
jgi:ABC-2 type transport system permease protein